MFRVRLLLLAASLAILAAAVWMAGCNRGSSASKTATDSSATAPAPAAATAASSDPSSGQRAATPEPAEPLVVLKTTLGEIKLQLFAKAAPQTVDNFLSNYANRSFYDQTIFHHVEAGQMLIAGGYTAELEPKPTRAPIYNESRNGKSNRRGTVAMIRDPEAPHTATSQFFINLADNADFDFKAGEPEDTLGYCVFGEVVEGLEIADRISKLSTTTQGEFDKVPTPTVAILSVQRLR
jgi:peptidyl-prolyl cis-trans isomerase A (cyclophilin A)